MIVRAALGIILARGRGSTDQASRGPYYHDRGPIFPNTTRASSASKLFIIWHSVSDSKRHFRWLALKNACLLHPSLKYIEKISIFLASSGSFNMKNDNIHSFFFSPFWLQILNLPASLQNKNTRIGPFQWKRSVL